jgi:uncharacterized protein
MPDCGLSEEDLAAIISILDRHRGVEEALIFGSRAKGNFKHGSDVDLAVKGAAITHEVIVSISSELNEETNMPYRFDVVNFHSIESRELLEDINLLGVRMYPQI